MIYETYFTKWSDEYAYLQYRNGMIELIKLLPEDDFIVGVIDCARDSKLKDIIAKNGLAPYVVYYSPEFFYNYNYPGSKKLKIVIFGKKKLEIV